MKTCITTSGQLSPFLKHMRAQQGLSQAALGMTGSKKSPNSASEW